ncbi:MAG: DUF3576 domain-containing protein [Alphaproteobacteria bacterium]
MASRVMVATIGMVALVSLGGCNVFGSGTAHSAPTTAESNGGRDETGGIGVNSYLWRASLATVDFMPLASADPWGGVITTDWYANPAKPDERFKVTVYILDTRLRADGVSCAVFKETKVDGQWATAPVSPDTNVAMENAILSKARQLRLSTIE